ncbi:unnamed protein product [Parascedosporium putredinis]|uniref:Uncharacterized protein n=1 Tax=Parascedosporium putredinis TaxID=1442378 RepID=A0A9P1HDS8_9PEZI|nr:unnamed protein product [Parascedosporium putredinis]CAI8005087.1 unnamed protein product [Parascedosporium putredinis]
MAAIECIKMNIELMRVKEGLPQGILGRAVFPLLIKFGLGALVSQYKDLWPKQHDQETTDITGPREQAYLSSLSTFRRAQTRATENRPKPTLERASPQIQLRDGSSLPPRPPVISPLRVSPTGLISQFRTGPNEEVVLLPQSTDLGEDWATPDDYAQLATEMSDYLTWDIGKFPEWAEFDSNRP